MSDRREEILNSEHQKLIDDRGFPRDGGELVFVHRPAAISAMDQYMKESCLALLQYMADNNIKLSFASTSQEPLFMWKGNLLTKEQVFENFL